MNVYLFDEQNSLKIDHNKVKTLVQIVVEFEGQRANEATIHFVDVAAICDLHAQYFDDPSPTDCISFPIDSPDEKGYRVLGEVFVCPQTAVEYAKQEGGDPLHETTLYIVHGLLHLMGYDDTEDLVEQMRIAEKRHMDHLQHLGLWLNSPS